jgi:hypothetical protein
VGDTLKLQRSFSGHSVGHTWPTLDLPLQAAAHWKRVTYSGPPVDDTPKLQWTCSASHLAYPRLTLQAPAHCSHRLPPTVSVSPTVDIQWTMPP